jgi:hypothetical protein
LELERLSVHRRRRGLGRRHQPSVSVMVCRRRLQRWTLRLGLVPPVHWSHANRRRRQRVGSVWVWGNHAKPMEPGLVKATAKGWQLDE